VLVLDKEDMVYVYHNTHAPISKYAV